MSGGRLDRDELKLRLEEARKALPVRSVLERFGLDVGTKGTNCPFCGKKGKFSLAGDDGFFCFSDNCEAARGAKLQGQYGKDALGLYQIHLGLPFPQAVWQFCLDAGTVSSEEFDNALSPPASAPRRGAPPEPAEPAVPTASSNDNMPLEQGIQGADDPESGESPFDGEDSGGGKPSGEDAGGDTPSGEDAPRKRKRGPRKSKTAAAKRKRGPRKGKTAAAPENVVDFPGTGSGEADDPLAGIDEPTRAAPALTNVFDPGSSPWNFLHRHFPLADRHRIELIQKRGISEEVLEKVQFRSSVEDNRRIIEDLRRRGAFTDDHLLNLGILQRKDSIVPNYQLTGLGNTGRKDDGGDPVFDWISPILIPYGESVGRVEWMRPHKGGLKTAAHLRDIYKDIWGKCLFNPAKHPKVILLTEGEFKAAAAASCGHFCVAIPGITFVNNAAFLARVGAWLRTKWADELVIVFDNEVKDDPAFPERFKEDPDKRYEADAWALVVAHRLSTAVRKVRVGRLEDKWLEDGKADFDGIVARCLREHGEAKGRAVAGATFEKTIKEATSPYKTLGLFDGRKERIIAGRVARLITPRQIEIGGQEERDFAYRMRAIDPVLQAAFNSVNGIYFTRTKPQKEARATLVKELKALEKEKDEAGDTHDSAAIRRGLRIDRCRELLDKGHPKDISNFSLTGLLRVQNHEGKQDKLVRVYVPLERRALIARLPASAASSLREFRKWASETFSCTFGGGERDLQAITRDLDTDTTHREVVEVDHYGHHEQANAWIMGDCAFAPDGKLIEPDENNVFWHDLGYQVESDKRRLGHDFAQGAPLLFPKGIGNDGEDTFDMKAFAEEWQSLLYDWAGGHEVTAAIGLALAYGAMPEFMARHGKQHPGIWFNGLYGGGKTWLATCFLEMWGFRGSVGTRVTADTTDVAMNRILAQNSCLPALFDEYRNAYMTDMRDSVLRNSFGRTPPQKGRMDHSTRTRSVFIHTTPIVCGENASRDSATRSRFLNVQISDRKRKPDPGHRRFRRLEDMRDDLYRIGRFILRHRATFSAAFLSHFESFHNHPDTVSRKVGNRVRLVHACAYAGIAALAETLESETLEATLPSLRPWLAAYMAEADASAVETNFLNRFWEDVITGISTGAIGRKWISLEWVKRNPETNALSHGLPMDAESFEVICLAPEVIYSEYEQLLRKRDHKPDLSRQNLSQQLSMEPYWVSSGRNHSNKARFDGERKVAWLVARETFPFADELLTAANKLNVTPADGIEMEE